MSERDTDTDKPSIDTPAETGRSTDISSSQEFSYSRELTEQSAQRAFGEGMDAAGMALSLRALEESEGHSNQRGSPESFIKKILEQRAQFPQKSAASRIIEERQAAKNSPDNGRGM
jgi:hypothetical protein